MIRRERRSGSMPNFWRYFSRSRVWAMRGFRHMSFKGRVDREDLDGRGGIGSLTSYLEKSSQRSAFS